MAHLIQVRLQRLVLRSLLCERLLGLGALVLDLLRVVGALGLEILLALILLPSEHHRYECEHDRDYEQLQPLPHRHSTEAPSRLLRLLGLLAVRVLASHRALLIPHIPVTIIANTDESRMNQELAYQFAPANRALPSTVAALPCAFSRVLGDPTQAA